MIDEEKLRAAVTRAEWTTKINNKSWMAPLVDLANQVLSAEWPEKIPHEDWCQVDKDSPCDCGNGDFNKALDLCRLAAAKDRLKPDEEVQEYIEACIKAWIESKLTESGE